MTKAQVQPDAAAGVKSAALSDTPLRYGDKNDVATMLGMSKRTVDNLMAQGCPHLRIGSRRCRFDLTEVRQWLSENFRTQRNGKLNAA
jgi:predicted DNA-binding transcriptional regulator AlpA